eukprot:2442528-Alexandrium_andersonii.AAC.1
MAPPLRLQAGVIQNARCPSCTNDIAYITSASLRTRRKPAAADRAQGGRAWPRALRPLQPRRALAEGTRQGANGR